jgi:hypothetical protein
MIISFKYLKNWHFRLRVDYPLALEGWTIDECHEYRIFDSTVNIWYLDMPETGCATLQSREFCTWKWFPLNSNNKQKYGKGV